MIAQIPGQIFANSEWPIYGEPKPGSIQERIAAMYVSAGSGGDPSGSELLAILGEEISPIYYGEFFDPYLNWGAFTLLGIYWVYHQGGMLISSLGEGKGTCAKVLYGPILDYYATLGQFVGPLGVPMTDVQTLPDGTSFAVFRSGVLYLNKSGQVQVLQPVTPGLIKAIANIDNSPAGITALAQQNAQSMANNAIQNNSQLKNNVKSINASVTFKYLYNAEFVKSNPNLQYYDVNLPYGYVFGVHLDIQLSGCAGTFGGASADFSAEALVQLQPQAKVVPTSIQGTGGGTGDPINASSPFGAANDQIKLAIQQALENAGTLLNKPLPTSPEVLALIVAPDGTANIYIEPICTTSTLFQDAEVSDAHAVLQRIRKLRDSYLTPTSDGQILVQLESVIGPILLEAIGRESDGRDIVRSVGAFLERAFGEDADVATRSTELSSVSKHAQQLMNIIQHGSARQDIERLTNLAVRFARDHIKPESRFDEVMARLDALIIDEISRASQA